MYLNEDYGEVHTDKNLSDAIPMQNCLKKKRFITTAFQKGCIWKM
jgi:hypothetical protein